MPISFCSYNSGRDFYGGCNGPGFCLCFCMQSRLQVSRKLRLCTSSSSEQHSQERIGPDRSGKSVLKAITSFEIQSSSKIFSWKRHLKHVLREQKEMQIKKKNLHFPLPCTPQVQPCSSVRCGVFIYYCTVCSYTSAFLPGFSIVRLSTYHFIRHCSPQHYSKMGQTPEKYIKGFSYLP